MFIFLYGESCLRKKKMTGELNDVLNDMVDLDSDPGPLPYMRHTMSKNKFTNKDIQKHIMLLVERISG